MLLLNRHFKIILYTSRERFEKGKIMVAINGLTFSLHELAGSVGDFGTLITFTLGYLVLCAQAILAVCYYF
jgi:hypothetical protein